MKHKQKGMTLIGWIGTIAIVLLLALAAIRLAPVYLQYFRIADVIRKAPIEFQNQNDITPQKIVSYLEKRFDVEAVTVIGAKDVKIKRQNDNYLVTADYDHKVPFLANINFLVEFDTESKVRR